jgi:hypothetical protein
MAVRDSGYSHSARNPRSVTFQQHKRADLYRRRRMGCRRSAAPFWARFVAPGHVRD